MRAGLSVALAALLSVSIILIVSESKLMVSFLPVATDAEDEAIVAQSSLRISSLSTKRSNPSLGLKIYHENNAKRNETLASSDFLFPDSPLHDKTLPWNGSIRRLWLDPAGRKPPAMLLLTNIGWNQENQTLGSQEYRGMRARQFMDGIINHEWFSNEWEALNYGRIPISNTTRYYVFVDRDMCKEKNFPKYGFGDYANIDAPGRGNGKITTHLGIEPVMKSRLLQEARHVKVIVWDCGGAGPSRPHTRARRAYGDRIVFASLSSVETQLTPGLDMGLPPPVVVPCNLSHDERKAIQTCSENRKVLFSFSGMIRFQARRDLLALHNGKDILMFRGRRREVTHFYNTTDFALAYHILSKDSIFAACPRGDNMFSYRLVEQMSCGAIPVVYADGWVLPFTFVDWKSVAVTIRESDAPNSTEILRKIDKETQCKMRQKGLELYEKYLKDGRGVIRGIVESMEHDYYAKLDNRFNSSKATMS